jgi:hypothetical protein
VSATAGPAQGGATIAARWVFAAMVLACFGAFFLTQRLKHTPTLVQRVTALPFFSYQEHQERLSFHTDHNDVITVSVLTSPGGRYVATMRTLPAAALSSCRSEPGRLARDLAVLRYCQIRVSWDGLTASGAMAPVGTYEFSVYFADDRRAVVPPQTFTIDPAPHR